MTEGRGVGRVSLILLGMAIAVAGEMSVGLLVFNEPGLLDAITVVLAVQLAALASGLATPVAVPDRPGRWRWFIAAGGYLIAAAASISWNLDVDLMASWSTRGVSLALLAAVPMYGGGVAVGAVRSSPDVNRGTSVVVGAAIGVALMGSVLLGRLEPAGIYLFGLFGISIGALATGLRRAALDRSTAHSPQGPPPFPTVPAPSATPLPDPPSVPAVPDEPSPNPVPPPVPGDPVPGPPPTVPVGPGDPRPDLPATPPPPPAPGRDPTGRGGAP